MDKENPQSAIRNPQSQKHSFAVITTLFLLPLIYFFPAVLGKVTLAPGDGWTQILGIRVLIGQMIAQGELPLWNPYIFAGMPLLASIQPGALYPPTWLFAVLSPQVAMNALVITTYHVALFGTYLFARRIGTTRVGALIAAMAFSFGGYMVAHLGHTNRINAAAWLPWILLAIENCVGQVANLSHTKSWRWVTLGALFIALQQFAGDPQMTLYSAMVAGAFALFTIGFRLQSNNRARFVALLAAMGVCGAMLSMIQFFPARELLALGDRSAIDYEYFSQYSFPPRQTLGLFFPYFFGGASTSPYGVPYWGKWNPAETLGYVGMATWLLAFAAVFATQARSATSLAGQIRNLSRHSPAKPETDSLLIWFWAALAAVALLLAFGSFLPFGINHLLHKIPVYKLFRASGRNLMEFNFALAMLAGLGATALTNLDRVVARRVLLKSFATLAAVVGLALIVYRFFDERLVTEIPLPPEAGALTNPEIFVPVAFFAMSVASLLVYARRWSLAAGAVLVIVLFLDLASWGFAFEWQWINDQRYNVPTRLSDSASVKFLKEREKDWASFRTLSHSENQFKDNTDLLNYPNISIARGLQSVNGYDPVRLGQMAEVAGKMTLDGYVVEPEAFDSTHLGFNLLNAKYLLIEHTDKSNTFGKIEIDGVSFNDPLMDLSLKPNSSTQIQTQASATELVIVSAMGNSDNLPDGEPIVAVKLLTKDGQVIERQLLAGRDTSEWAIDREDVKARVKHTRAPIAESWDGGGFQGHRFIARLKFDRAEIADIELRYLPNQADIVIARASLFDAETQASHPLDGLKLPLDRWRPVARFGAVRVYENLKVLPRAWFTTRAVIAPSLEVLNAIKTGKLANGDQINLTNTVLLESELFAKRQLKTPLASPSSAVAGLAANSTNDVKVTRYSPNRIELQANNSQPGFLVLSEIYFRGWEAWVDGKRASVDRVNFTLRGLELSPGNHKIEFVFRAPSFRAGAVYFAIGLLLLGVGGIVSYRKRQ